MTFEEAIAELGIDRDASAYQARRAYLALLKTRKPETDPQGFMRLREAYDLVKDTLTAPEPFRRMIEARTAQPAEGGPRKGHVAVRLDAPTLARLDALLALYTLPGQLPTRSDGLRAIILAGLEVEERRSKERGPPEPPAPSR